MKVRFTPFHTGFCTTGSHRACPHEVTVTRKEGNQTYTKPWTCKCECHEEAVNE